MWQTEQSRLGNERREYKADLDRELHQKMFKEAQDRQQKIRSQEDYNKLSFSPNDVARMERDRKTMEMTKYREDLDKSSPSKGEKIRMMAGAQIIGNGSNDFNVHSEGLHNPMLNPLPFNVQNPYLLRQISQKDQTLRHTNASSLPNNRIIY